ncbi:MAG: hypothetical protein Q9165_006465 [Trypethelium subeluteriae]
MSKKPEYKLFLFFTRNPDLSPAEFRAYYEAKHVPLVMEVAKTASGLQRYKRHYIDHASSLDSGNPFTVFGAEVPPFDFDVVSEVVFQSKEQAEGFAKTMYSVEENAAGFVADENKLFIRNKMRGMVIEEIISSIE